MIVEILQFMKMVSAGIFYYLPVHLVVFVAFPLILRTFLSARYESFHSASRDDFKVSVVIPEYMEDLDVFERCLRSVRDNNPDEIIVVSDDGRPEVVELSRKYGAKVYTFPKRVGKRRSLVQGWRMATGDLIVHVDSDTILNDGAIDEIIKPFDDPQVAGVQGRVSVYRTGSWFAWRMGQLIELNRDFNCRALNGHLVVIDGRFNCWRREWLLEHAERLLNERFLGVRCEIGDDRYLTQSANLEGFKTVYQNTATAKSASQETYFKFVKQQLRWARSGYKAFFKDFVNRLKAPLPYYIFLVTYYVGPVSFTAAILHDVFFAPSSLFLPLWSVIPMAVLGSSIIVILRRLAVKFYDLKPKELLYMGVSSLFVCYPMMLYAIATVRKQNFWETR